MRPRDTVTAARFVIRHGLSPEGKLAADVFADAGSIVLAPADGRVVHTGCPDTAGLPGCQIRGYLELSDGRELGFVAAHLQRGTFPEQGMTFSKGQTLGKIALWEQRPKSTHVHWSFKDPGTGMPPKANIEVLRAFDMLGPAPPRTLHAEAVPQLEAEEGEHEAIPALGGAKTSRRESERMLVDQQLKLFADLRGPRYRYDSWGDNYQEIKRHGGNCYTTIDATLEKLGIRAPAEGTISLTNVLVAKQPYLPNATYPRGTFLLNDNAGRDYDWSHVGEVYDRETQKFIHCPKPAGVVIDGHHKETHFGWQSNANEWTRHWTGYEYAGYHPGLAPDWDPAYFDIRDKKGDWYIHPWLLAAFMAHVAEHEFDLPPVLPVACSMVELSSAWVAGPIDYRELRGYSKAVDFDSLGFFQQRPAAGWGSPDEIMDPNYAVEKFCEAAVDMQRGQNPNTAEGLGEWVADVQRPAEEYRGRYAKQIARARKLIQEGRKLIPEEYLKADRPKPDRPDKPDKPDRKPDRPESVKIRLPLVVRDGDLVVTVREADDRDEFDRPRGKVRPKRPPQFEQPRVKPELEMERMATPTRMKSTLPAPRPPRDDVEEREVTDYQQEREEERKRRAQQDEKAGKYQDSLEQENRRKQQEEQRRRNGRDDETDGTGSVERYGGEDLEDIDFEEIGRKAVKFISTISRSIKESRTPRRASED